MENIAKDEKIAEIEDLLIGDIPDELIFEMADHSYVTVVGKLPKYKQKKLFNDITE